MAHDLKHISSVALFGSADIPQTHPVCMQAYAVAQSLGQLGLRIVNGGGPGVMEAATNGARSVGAETLIVSFKPTNAPYFEGRAHTNQADREIIAENYIDRLGTLIDASDAFVIFQGGTGTLSEWTTVWLLAHIYYGHHKPIILFGNFWRETVEAIQKNFFIGDLETKVFRIVERMEDVYPALKELDTELTKFQEPLQHVEGHV